MGSVEITRDQLLAKCIDDQRESSSKPTSFFFIEESSIILATTFNLISNVNFPADNPPSITIRLLNRDTKVAVDAAIAEAGKAVETAKLGIIDQSLVIEAIDGVAAMNSTQSNLESALGGLVSKLDIMIKVLDKTSKVNGHRYM